MPETSRSPSSPNPPKKLVYTEDPVVEIPVQIGDSHYYLCEADGETAENYQNALVGEMSFVPGEREMRMSSSMATAQYVLLAGCLCYAHIKDGQPTKVKRDTRGNPYRVSIAEIRKFRPRIIKDLFEHAKEISALDEEDTLEDLIDQRDKLDARIEKLRRDGDPAKNEQDEMTAGSA